MEVDVMNKHRVFKLVLTGGPCGGKTKGISFLKKMLEEKGFKVLAFPEVASQITSIGAQFSEIPVYDFQDIVIKRMLLNEKDGNDLANYYKQDVIILYDRALLEHRAYMPYPDFVRLFNYYGLTEENVLSRYDAVFHLVTAANGALEYYMLDAARHETPEEACKIDLALQQAWSNHPKHTIIDNSTDFYGKLIRLLNKVLEIVK